MVKGKMGFETNAVTSYYWYLKSDEINHVFRIVYLIKNSTEIHHGGKDAKTEEKKMSAIVTALGIKWYPTNHITYFN